MKKLVIAVLFGFCFVVSANASEEIIFSGMEDLTQEQEASTHDQKASFLVFWQGKDLLFVDENMFPGHAGSVLRDVSLSDMESEFFNPRDLVFLNDLVFQNAEYAFADGIEKFGWKVEGMEGVWGSWEHACMASLMQDDSKIMVFCQNRTGASSHPVAFQRSKGNDALLSSVIDAGTISEAVNKAKELIGGIKKAEAQVSN